MLEPDKYWDLLSQLIADGDITIERPKGTSHPRYPDLIYPLDYGYIRNTRGSDDDAVDVWMGSLDTSQISGIICTVDTADRDVEVKILLGCTKEECSQILRIHNVGTQAALFLDKATHSNLS